MQVIQLVLSSLTKELFETVEKSLLVFLKILLDFLEINIDIYSQMSSAAKIELMVTLKAYARVLINNHCEDCILSYFKPFIAKETCHPEIITN